MDYFEEESFAPQRGDIGFKLSKPNKSNFGTIRDYMAYVRSFRKPAGLKRKVARAKGRVLARVPLQRYKRNKIPKQVPRRRIVASSTYKRRKPVILRAVRAKVIKRKPRVTATVAKRGRGRPRKTVAVVKRPTMTRLQALAKARAVLAKKRAMRK